MPALVVCSTGSLPEFSDIRRAGPLCGKILVIYEIYLLELVLVELKAISLNNIVELVDSEEARNFGGLLYHFHSCLTYVPVQT